MTPTLLLPPGAGDRLVPVRRRVFLPEHGCSRFYLPQGRVLVDPAFNVVASADDVQRFAATTFQTGATTFIAGRVSTTTYHAAARFTGVSIPSGSTILTCTLTMKVAVTGTVTTVNTLLHFENALNPAQISSYGDFDGRTLTTGTAWANIGAWFAGNTVVSPDFSAELQEVVDAQGGTGDAVIVFWKNNASSDNANRRAASYDNTTYTPPNITLTVTWTEPSGTPLQVVLVD